MVQPGEKFKILVIDGSTAYLQSEQGLRLQVPLSQLPSGAAAGLWVTAAGPDRPE